MITDSGRLAALAIVLVIAMPARAWAGMPTISLTDVATARLQTISFFLVMILAVTWIIQRGWNLYQRDQQWLPRLSYKGALGLIAVWALFLQLVLSMVGGARELMTPGAWVKAGVTYTLSDANGPPTMIARVRRIDGLRRALWDYAKEREGRLPRHEFVPEIAEDVWKTGAASGASFVYVGGRTVGERDRVIAYEPAVFGRTRLALYGDGEVREVDARRLPGAADGGR